MSTPMFVNLHHHDEYSMRDALGTCDQYAKLLKSRNEKYMAITNHGSIGGWIKQKNVCEKNGLKPIYGMEAYHSDYRGDDIETKKQNRSANHLILLAKNVTGYYNIIKIHNDAQLNGFYYTPRVNDEALKKWGEGVIGTSACMVGDIPKLLEQDNWDMAVKRYEFYRSCFDDFYIEIQLIEMEEQVNLNRKLISFAKKVGAKPVIGMDCLHGDTNITMSDGSSKKIKDIVVGDFVSTDDGLSSTVEAIGVRKARDGEKIYKIHSGPTHHDIICTEDHPFLVEFSSGRREWIKARDLRSTDYLVLPHPKRDNKEIILRTEDYFKKNRCVRKIENGWISTRTDKDYTVPEFIKVDKEFCWVLGLYIAEGYRDNYVCGFGLHRDENIYAENINKFFKRYGFNPTIYNHPTKKSKSVRISSFAFAPLFEKLLGKRCLNKKLPFFWKNLDDECLLALLDGYFCGDGCWSNETLGCCSVSENLIYQIQQAMLSLGFFSNIVKTQPKVDARTGNIDRATYSLKYGNKQVCEMLPSFHKINKIDRRKGVGIGSIKKEGYHLMKIAEVEEIQNKDYDFYDITVKDRHCFLAEARVVHNSHYLYAENCESHDIMMCIRQRRTIQETEEADDDTWTFSVKNLYCRSYEQLKDLYDNGFQGKNGHVTYKDDVFTQEVFDESCANTVKIAESIEDIQVDTSIKLPKMSEDSEKEFKKLVMEGFEKMGLDKKPNADEYKKRVKFEMDVITLAGWSDYFLVVKMITDEARRLKGDVGISRGRGSSCGCLCAYLIGITGLDPIEYDLDFARFLDFSRTQTTVCTFELGE